MNWDKYWAKYDREAHLKAAYSTAKVLKEMVGVYSTVLDAGCGEGVLVQAMRYNKLNAYGIDTSERAILESHAWEYSDGFLRVDDIGHPARPFQPSVFSLVTAIGVLYYLDDPTPALKEIHRLLREDGLLLVTVEYKELTERDWVELIQAQGFQRIQMPYSTENRLRSSLFGRKTGPLSFGILDRAVQIWGRYAYGLMLFRRKG